MKRLDRLIFVSLAMILAGLPAQADGFLRACLLPPAIVADIRITPPRETLTRPAVNFPGHSMVNMNAIKGTAVMVYGFDAVVDSEVISSGDRHCVRPVRIEIRSGHRAPEIWLHPMIRDDACRREVTMNHELEHVRHYHDHLTSFRANLQGGLAARLRDAGPVLLAPGESPRQGEIRLKETVRATIEAIHDRSAAIAHARDRAIDTPAEFLRLSSLCN